MAIYNLQRNKQTEIMEGEVTLWAAPDIATGLVIPLTDSGADFERSRKTVVFTSDKKFEDFIAYFGEHGSYSFKNTTANEMVFHYGKYLKSKSQKTQIHNPRSAVHAKAETGGQRSASSAVTGQGYAADAARFGLDLVSDMDNFGASTAIKPLMKMLGVLKVRYYVLVSVRNKYGAVAKIHNGQGSPQTFLNDGGVGSVDGVKFSVIATALRDFAATKKKKFGSASGAVDLPEVE